MPQYKSIIYLKIVYCERHMYATHTTTQNCYKDVIVPDQARDDGTNLDFDKIRFQLNVKYSLHDGIGAAFPSSQGKFQP